MSSLVDACSSAGVCPISRLLRRWWVQRGRSSCLRSLLLRRHVDEDDEDLARVNAGSGSHNLDPPTWRANDVGGLIHEHLWDRRTGFLSVRRGRRLRKEQIEAMHASDLPRFGPHGCVKPYSCFVVCIEFLLGSAECYSTPQQPTRPSVSVLFLPPSPLYVAHGPPFICSRGHRQVATETKGKNGKVLR